MEQAKRTVSTAVGFWSALLLTGVLVFYTANNVVHEFRTAGIIQT